MKINVSSNSKLEQIRNNKLQEVLSQGVSAKGAIGIMKANSEKELKQFLKVEELSVEKKHLESKLRDLAKELENYKKEIWVLNFTIDEIWEERKLIEKRLEQIEWIMIELQSSQTGYKT